MLVVFLVTFGEQSFLPIGCHCCDVVCHVQRKVWTDRFFFISVQADEIIYRMTQKKRSSPKIEQLPNFYLDWHKTSATLGQACVADISKVSSLYYKNSLFQWRSKNVLQMSSPALQAHSDPAGKVLDCRPRTRMVQWCHFWRWQPRQCTSQSVMAFADSAQGVCYPRRCCS